MDKIIIVGSSEHARVIIDLIEQENKYQIAGLVDPKRPIGELVSGYPVIGREEDIPALMTKNQVKGAVVAIGDNWVRSIATQKIQKIAPELLYVSPIHPSAIIGKDVSIGKGTVIMPGVCINTGSIVGDFCIVNTRTSIDHDCTLGNYVSIAPGVTTGGKVQIGEFTAVSLGVNILHGITIGQHSVIGAGAMVNKNIEDEVVAYGVPAKVVRNRSKGEKYL